MQIERHLALNLPLFPHAPEIPAETCRSLAEPDDDPTTPAEGLREARGGLRRLLLEEVWGSPRRVAATTPGGGPRKLAKGCGDYSLRMSREGRRRLLLEEIRGSPRRAAATTFGESLGEARRGRRRLLREKACGSLWRAAAASLGDIAGKLTAENGTQPQTMKFCIFPGFFHILAKSPGSPPRFLT